MNRVGYKTEVGVFVLPFFQPIISSSGHTMKWIYRSRQNCRQRPLFRKHIKQKNMRGCVKFCLNGWTVESSLIYTCSHQVDQQFQEQNFLKNFRPKGAHCHCAQTKYKIQTLSEKNFPAGWIKKGVNNLLNAFSWSKIIWAILLITEHLSSCVYPHPFPPC